MICEHMLPNHGTDLMAKAQAFRIDTTLEATLVKAAQQGDLSAFNQLVLTYQDDLYGWVVSYVQDERTAEDITQQVFITAYQKIKTMRLVSFRAWIFKIARNRSIDELRYRRRHPSLSLDDNPQDEESGDLLSILPDQGLTPEWAVIQSEQAARLNQLLMSLSEPYRQALFLVDLYEMDYQEAAQVLNLPLGTLKSRVSRARLWIRERMETELRL